MTAPMTPDEVRRALEAQGVPGEKAERAAWHVAETAEERSLVCHGDIVRALARGEPVGEAPAAPSATERPDRVSGKARLPSRRNTAAAGRTEAQVQREIVAALKAAGWSVWRIGQRNAKGTQDAGVPDLYALRPVVRDFDGYSIAHDVWQAWIECKRPVRGRQSPAQVRFQNTCEVIGVRYILARGLDDIRELLT